MGEWTLILGALAIPLVILPAGYRFAMAPKFFVLAAVVLLLGAALLVAWRSIDRGRAPFFLPWTLFLGVTGVGAARSLNADSGIEMLVLQLCGGAVGISSALLVDRFDRLLRAVALVGICVAVVGMLEYLGVSWTCIPSSGRPSATLGFRNILGMYLAIGIFPAAALVLQPRRSDRILGGLAFLLMAVLLIFTRTRGAWLGVLVASLLGLGAGWRVLGWAAISRILWQYRVAVFGSFIVVAIAGAIPPKFRDRNLSRLDENKSTLVSTIQFMGQEGGDRGRLKIWSHTFQMIREKPLFGVGLQNWAAYYPRYDRGDVMGIGVAPERPHNDFLWVAAEMGLPGLVVYLWLLIVIARRVWVGIARQDWFALMWGLGAVALLVHGAFSFPREQPVAVFFLSLALGLAGRSPGSSDLPPRKRNLAIGFAVVGIGIAGLIEGAALLKFDADFSRALYAQEEGRPEKQIEAAIDAQKFGILDHRVLLLEGLGRYTLGDYEGAITAYRTYLRYQPFLPAVLNNLGQSLEALGQEVEAEAVYKQALDTFTGDGSGILISNLAAVYKKRGETEKALVLLKDAAALPAEGHHNLGIMYAEAGLWDKSLEAYRQALVQDPGMTIAYFSVAGVQLLKGDFGPAAQNYETFLNRWRGSSDYVRDANHRLRQIYPTVADGYLRDQKFDDAARVYERLVALGDDSPEILNNLILNCGRLGQFDRAISYGKIALEHHPGFAQTHLSMATVYEGHGDRAKAIQHYRKFIAAGHPNGGLMQRARDRIKMLAASGQ